MATAAMMKVVLAMLAHMQTVGIDTTHIKPKELFCLSNNVYHEARSEPELAQAAVAHVTLNRVHSDKYPKTICKVVYQDSQFSWTLDKKPVKNPEAWSKAVSISASVMAGLINDPTEGALYYHTRDVSPVWAQDMNEIQLGYAWSGDHVFLKEQEQ